MSNRPGYRRYAVMIPIEAVLGSRLEDVGEDMISLAQRLDVGVTCNLNGVRITAFPHTRPEQLQLQHENGRHLAATIAE